VLGAGELSFFKTEVFGQGLIFAPVNLFNYG